MFQELGEQARRESDLGAPTDIEGLRRTITRLEQRTVELTEAMEESFRPIWRRHGKPIVS
ncbi:hypothetical protein ACFZAV_39230 [Streptomyces sp. NPDC008343]|uniref:hypothetical protein n=1 Tax=Streptomyces sp. NPDC008343 TaxID=3364828 RepID=UPI0036EB0345